MMHPRSPWHRRVGPGARRAPGPVLAAGLLLGLGFAFHAARAAGHNISISGQWMRFVIAARPAAGYFVLHNATDAPVRLTGATSSACGQLMLHQSVRRNGQEAMTMVKSVPVPAHGMLAFAPGGYHLMCMSPTAAVAPGASVPVTLRFQNGETLTAPFPVRGMAGARHGRALDSR